MNNIKGKLIACLDDIRYWIAAVLFVGLVLFCRDAWRFRGMPSPGDQDWEIAWNNDGYRAFCLEWEYWQNPTPGWRKEFMRQHEKDFIGRGSRLDEDLQPARKGYTQQYVGPR